MTKGKPLSNMVVRQSFILGQWYICTVQKNNPDIAVHKVEISEDILDTIMISRLKKMYETDKENDIKIPTENGMGLRIHIEEESMELKEIGIKKE